MASDLGYVEKDPIGQLKKQTKNKGRVTCPEDVPIHINRVLDKREYLVIL